MSVMRYTALLILIGFLAICTSRTPVAQGVVVSGHDVLYLAKTIVKSTSTSHRLPSSYQLAIGNKQVITAPMAFEILARTLALHQKSQVFPQAVSGLTLAFSAKSEPSVEPDPQKLEKIAIWTPDLLDQRNPFFVKTLELLYQIPLLGVSQQKAITIPRQIVLPKKNKLNLATFIVTMARLVQEWGENGTIPELLSISAVMSPANWNDVSAPVPLIAPVTLRVWVNGAVLQRTDDGTLAPAQAQQVYCGDVQVMLMSGGPVKTLALELDGLPLNTFTHGGTQGYTLDSTQVTDGAHELAVVMTDEDDKRYAVTIPLQIQNGRVSAFTPAELNGAAGLERKDM